jgi:hypothetical protein
MSVEPILRDADQALEESRQTEEKVRLQAMTRFMRCFERLAIEIAEGNATWDEVRPWAAERVERVRAAWPALTDWQHELGRIFYIASRGEEETEAALDRRSQHAFAREAFRDTPVDEMLAEFEDPEVDQDFKEEAERIALDAPPYAPPSHTWWRRRAATG